MKKVWMIHERYISTAKYTGMTFNDEKTADEFCKLLNDGDDWYYFSKPLEVYESIEDYKMNNNDAYTKKLWKAIDTLQQSILPDRKEFRIYINEYYGDFTFDELNDILAGNFGKYTVMDHDGYFRHIEDEDLPEIKKEYQRVQQEIEDMKVRLDKYMKELCANMKSKTEEKEM